MSTSEGSRHANGSNGDAGLRPEVTIPHFREFVGGDLLAQSLIKLGVNVAFGIHGGHLDAFLMGAHEAGIRLVDTRHETVAVQAAEGYSKAKNQVGVCFVTANSGFGNSLPGLATAFADRSSILCITSSSPQRDAETNALQGFHDQVVLSKPVTRFCHRVVHVEEIPRLLAHAFHAATASPPGPVLLDFPIEVLFSPVQVNRIAWGSISSPLTYPPGVHPEAVAVALTMLQESTRPVIVTGTGARGLENDAPFQRFVEASQIPVFHSNKYSGSLPFEHPMRAGVANLLLGLKAKKQPVPDLVILIGARTGFLMGSRSEPCLPDPEICKYIQVDIDAGEIGRSTHIHLGITADAKAAAAVLGASVVASGYKAPAEWTKAALSLKNLEQHHEQEKVEYEPGVVHPYHALKNAFKTLPAGSVISIDGGETGSWTVSTEEFARPSRVIFSCGYLGFLGNGWGYCLGASVAEPDKLIVNVQGDGSAGLHLAELDSYARHGARVLTIVCNNFCWGMSQAGQELIYPHTDARPAAMLSQAMDFAAVGTGIGLASERVGKAADIAPAVERLLKETAAGRPALLEILTSKHPIHPGTIAMVGATDAKDVVVVPYYDNVPRANYD